MEFLIYQKALNFTTSHHFFFSFQQPHEIMQAQFFLCFTFLLLKYKILAFSCFIHLNGLQSQQFLKVILYLNLFGPIDISFNLH